MVRKVIDQLPASSAAQEILYRDLPTMVGVQRE
jgi:hypothetical protein